MTDETPTGFRSGFAAVVGRPNVGKSTMMNALLGQKVAITSPKPQTTRRRQLGILTQDDAQIVFVDTPGLNEPRRQLDNYMRQEILAGLEDIDVVLWVVDISQPPGEHEHAVADLLRTRVSENPAVIAMNKSDLLKPENVISHTEAYQALLPGAKWMLVSATRGDNLPELRRFLLAALPEGPLYYPADQVTDVQLRDLAAELVREAALHLLRQEIPHGIAVEIVEFSEEPGELPHITANILVERNTHKGIVIGKGGQMLKAIGSRARQEIEAQVDSQVFLELHVKVAEDWRDDPRQLGGLGYR